MKNIKANLSAVLLDFLMFFYLQVYRMAMVFSSITSHSKQMKAMVERGWMRDVSANDTHPFYQQKAKIFIESTADNCFLLCLELCCVTRPESESGT